MDIKVGDQISIKHYSGVTPFKSVVISVDDESIDAKLTKDFAVMNFLEDDPVVFGYETENEIHIVGCNIQNINAKEGIIKLKIDKVDSGVNQRFYERYPVSLYADVRVKETRKKCLATVKDISYYGMLIYSKAELAVGDRVEVDIYMEKAMVFLKANIVRKVARPNFIEYGLGIVYEDSNSLSFMKEYIKRLKQEQEESIRKLRNW